MSQSMKFRLVALLLMAMSLIPTVLAGRRANWG